MTALSRLICTLIGGLLIGFPGLVLAEDSCVLTGETELSSYVDRLADGISKEVAYNYGQGDGETPEKAFVRGAIAVRATDLFLTVQFDRGGRVTDFDVHRQGADSVDEVLVHLLDDCLTPYEEVLGALTGHIEKQVKAQLAQEEERKAKMGL
jgi:hypothetical protein